MFEGRAGERIDTGEGEHGYVETDPTCRYGRFTEVLGKGATKIVYRAFDELLGMEVAWNQAKLNDVFRSPEELQRLYSEVHLLSTLNHDSIIRFYASWIDVERRTINFITEMFTSGTLREYRSRYKRVNIRAVKNWSRQILRGLVFLHGHDPPVIHRDLKCDNIFVNGHLGQVKIGDLGLAAILRRSQAAHSVIGTPEFMAPELYEEEYNELVDIYSFGMCVLEMLTSEYPYIECSNPAQIYKKVTSGKLPDAFYRLRDAEAQKFIGKCLERASKRLSAKELLLDPFLSIEEDEFSLTGNYEAICDNAGSNKWAYKSLPEVYQSAVNRGTDMTITGKMNSEDDTIFLKVQIGDKNGNIRNIYFPFEIVTDTPIDVATEMVKELEITDRDPHEIAEVIDEEISALVPHWKDKDTCHPDHDHQYAFNYKDDEDEECHYPCCSPTPSSPSQASLLGFAYYRCANDGSIHHPNWSLDEFADDTSSLSSLNSYKYSNVNYYSGSDYEHDLSPIKRELESFMKSQKSSSQKSSRFCPNDPKTRHSAKFKGSNQCHSPRSSCKATDNHFLMRNRSMVDVRSQMLHRSLVDEVNKRRLFKTVGAVENIGFQAPCQLPPKSPMLMRASSSRSP